MDVDAIHAQKTVGYGRTCIAARGHKHMDVAAVIASAYEVLEQTGHEARAYILEGQCRAVKQFKTVNARLDFDHRSGKRESVAYDGVEVRGGYVVAEESPGHRAGHLVKRHVVDVVKKLSRKSLYAFGHIQATVGSEPLDHGLGQCHVG